MSHRVISSVLHNGAIVFDIDSTQWGEPPIDQSAYLFAVVESRLKTIEQQNGKMLKIDLHPQTAVLVRPGDVEAVYADGAKDQRVLMKSFIFRKSLIQSVLGEQEIDGTRELKCPISSGLLSAAARLNSESDPLLVDHVTMSIMHLLRGIRDDAEAPSKGRISRAIAYVNERLDKPLTLEELAGAAHMSPFHFARTFRRETGTTPLAYVTAKRVDRAKALLAKSGMTIAAIAMICGFASQSHFSTAFKNRVGVTPNEFRRTLGVRRIGEEIMAPGR